MFFIPYSSAFHFSRQPYITYAVIIICIALQQLQWHNRQAIEEQAKEYCLTVEKAQAEDASFDFFKRNRSLCSDYLIWMHESVGRDVISLSLKQRLEQKPEYSSEQIAQAIANAKKHYQVFRLQVPDSLDGQLLYYPDDTNLWRMLTATFAHADWLHLMANLLFFFAFAPGVEALINNKLKYALVFVSLAFICHMTYSLYSAGLSVAVPTLGLSGVVMGMIGVSAYLMPNARIKVFVWGYRFVQSYYIPAWILAVFYIGWDSLNLYWSANSGGVNLVSHVSGGFAGLMIAFIFFRQRRRETKKQLADEVDYQLSRKKDANSYDLSSTYGRDRAAERYQLKQSKKQYEAFLQQLYTLVSVKKDADAVMLLISDEERYRQDFQLLEKLFESISHWGKSRSLLCTGRLLIELLISKNQHVRAINIVKECQRITPAFVLADAGMSLLLVRYAIEIHEINVAYHLLHDAEHRYDSTVDITAMRIKEAELCLMYLDKPEQAKAIVKQLLSLKDVKYKTEIMALAKLTT